MEGAINNPPSCMVSPVLIEASVSDCHPSELARPLFNPSLELPLELSKQCRLSLLSMAVPQNTIIKEQTTPWSHSLMPKRLPFQLKGSLIFNRFKPYFRSLERTKQRMPYKDRREPFLQQDLPVAVVEISGERKTISLRPYHAFYQAIIQLIDKKEKAMFPSYYAMLPPPPYPLCTQEMLHPHFLPLPYPYYYPLPFNSPTEPFHTELPLPQSTPKQPSTQLELKPVPSEHPSPRKAPNKKSSKQQPRVAQAVRPPRKQLSWSADFGQQKEGRNANSNLLRMFFRRLEFKIENHPHTLKQVWNKLAPSITIQQFAEWLREARVDYRNYIRVPSVRRLFLGKGRQGREEGMLLRVLLRHFLESESISCYLTSRKIKKESMPHNFTSIRSITQELLHPAVPA